MNKIRNIVILFLLKFKAVIFVTTFILVYLFSGQEAYQIEQDSAAYYCDMISRGLWGEHEDSTKCK